LGSSRIVILALGVPLWALPNPGRTQPTGRPGRAASLGVAATARPGSPGLASKAIEHHHISG